MNRIIATVLLAAAAVSGCSSLPDSIRGPFARSSSTASDVDVHQPAEVSPYPQATDQGKF